MSVYWFCTKIGNRLVGLELSAIHHVEVVIVFAGAIGADFGPRFVTLPALLTNFGMAWYSVACPGTAS